MTLPKVDATQKLGKWSAQHLSMAQHFDPTKSIAPDFLPSFVGNILSPQAVRVKGLRLNDSSAESDPGQLRNPPTVRMQRVKHKPDTTSAQQKTLGHDHYTKDPTSF